MELRRLWLIKDVTYSEGGLPAIVPVMRVAACAVIANPLAGVASDDLAALIEIGEIVGDRLTREAQVSMPRPATSYGKAAIIGTAGDIEHAAALLHPRMGKPMRSAIGGGQAIIPSTAKVGSAGATIDVPLGHKDDVWSFDHIDTLTISVPGAPRPDEIVVIIVLADSGRPRPRVASSGVVPPHAAT